MAQVASPAAGENIYRWTAKRSGAGIAVTGWDCHGGAVRLQAVSIQATPQGVRATCAHGHTYHLVTAAQK